MICESNKEIFNFVIPHVLQYLKVYEQVLNTMLLLVCKWWPQPLNRGDRLKDVKITVIKGSKFWDFENWLLNGGWQFNMVLLNTGLTVACENAS